MPGQRLCTNDPCHPPDRKSTRLNSSHDQISYAVFCLKKKQPATGRRYGRPPAHALHCCGPPTRHDAESSAPMAPRDTRKRQRGEADGPCFFFNDTATTEIYTLSLHDALPI